MSLKLQSGELVTVEPWDCEGVEPPWGWTSTAARKNWSDAYEQKHATKISRTDKKKLSPGVSGLVIDLDHLGVDDYDTHYVVMINGQQLSIPVRFLHRVSSI